MITIYISINKFTFISILKPCLLLNNSFRGGYKEKAITKEKNPFMNMKGIDNNVALPIPEGSFSFFHPSNNNSLLNTLSVGGIFFIYLINTTLFKNFITLFHSIALVFEYSIKQEANTYLSNVEYTKTTFCYVALKNCLN